MFLPCLFPKTFQIMMLMHEIKVVVKIKIHSGHRSVWSGVLRGNVVPMGIPLELQCNFTVITIPNPFHKTNQWNYHHYYVLYSRHKLEHFSTASEVMARSVKHIQTWSVVAYSTGKFDVPHLTGPFSRRRC